MDVIRAKVKRLGSQRKYDLKLYNSIAHQNCLEISDIDIPESFSEFVKRKLIQKFKGRFTGKEISRLLSPALQVIEDKNGEIIEYMITPSLRNEEILQEDFAIRSLLRVNYQTYLSRRPPGSYRLVSDYVVTKIIKSPNGSYLELHCLNLISGYENSVNILGDANECVAIDNHKINLEVRQAKWVKDDSMGNLDISESIHYKDRMKKIENHIKDCNDKSFHGRESDKFIFVEAKRFELIEKDSKYSVILHVERTGDTKDTEPLNSYDMNDVELGDLVTSAIDILRNTSLKEFLSSINSEFDLLYPLDKRLISQLHTKFCALAYEILDIMEEEYGLSSQKYIEFIEKLDDAYLSDSD